MSQKVKTTILVALGILIVLFVIAALSAPEAADKKPQSSSQPAAAPPAKPNEPPAPPEFQTSERRYEVVAVVDKDTYRGRELTTQAEVELFIPSDAIITAGQRDRIEVGTILTVQRFMEFTNGLVAVDLSISTKE